MSFNGSVILFGAMVEYHPVSASNVEMIWKGDIMAADIEELEEMEHIKTPHQKAPCKGS